MRLLYLTRQYSWHDSRWLRWLTAAGVEVAFLGLRKGSGDSGAALCPGVEMLPSPGLPALVDVTELDRAAAEIAGNYASWGIDAILAGPLTDAGYVACKIDPAHTLLMSWAFDVMYEPARDNEVGTRLFKTLRTADALFTDCATVHRECEKLAERTFALSCTMPWGLGAQDVVENPTARPSGDRFQFVYTRGFNPVHQPLAVIDAFTRAYRVDRRLKLGMAGQGELLSEAQRAIAVSDASDAIEIWGRLDQRALGGRLHSADAFVSFSLSDGSSVSLLQAMHAGLPCITADLPSNREWIGDERGACVPPHNIEALSAALLACARMTRSERDQLGSRNRQVVTERADLQRNLPRLLQTLRAVAARPNRVLTSCA